MLMTMLIDDNDSNSSITRQLGWFVWDQTATHAIELDAQFSSDDHLITGYAHVAVFFERTVSSIIS